MFSNGAKMNKQPIPLLHASSHDSRNLRADRSDGVHGGVLCKCEEKEVYSRKKKSLYLCVLHLNFYFNHPRHRPPLLPPREGTRSFAPGQSGPSVTDALLCRRRRPPTPPPPPGGFTLNLGGPCRISFKSRAQIIVWTRKCISALSCSSSCHSASYG